MSVKVMSLVWDGFPIGGTEKLAMLAMADWCNDEGGSLHPSHEAVAKKCCISRSQAVRIVRSLVNDGWLFVVGNQFGGAPGTTKQYRVNLQKLRDTGSTHATGTDSASATGSVDATGSTGATGKCGRRVASRTETGSTHATQTTSEPSVNQTTPLPPTPDKPARSDPPREFIEAWDAYPKRPGASKSASLKAWSARIKAGADPQLILDGVIRYAAFCKASATDPQYIKQPATFFGPDEHFLADWTVPTARGSPASRNGRAPTAVENYAAQAAAARGEGNARANPAERDITGDCTRVA